MADDKKLLEKLRKLYDAQRSVETEYREKMDAIAQEVTNLLGGGEGIGAILKRLEKHFSEAWHVRYRSAYLWNYTIDRAQWKRLLKTLSVEELEKRAIRYLRSSEPFFLQARHSFGIFVRSINQLGDEAAPASAELESEPPTGCKHAPSCKDDIQHTQRIQRELRA